MHRSTMTAKAAVVALAGLALGLVLADDFSLSGPAWAGVAIAIASGTFEVARRRPSRCQRSREGAS